jgi:hypothetical protein
MATPWPQMKDFTNSIQDAMFFIILLGILYHPGMVKPTIFGQAEPSQSGSKLDLLEPS